MKYIYLSITFLITSIVVNAQYGTGIDTLNPHVSAELHVVSPGNNTGVLLPVLTEAQMTNDISNPAHGLFVYNSTRKKYMYNFGIPASPLWVVMGELPIMDGTEMNTIAANLTANDLGMMVFNTVTNTVWYFKSTTAPYWAELQD